MSQNAGTVVSCKVTAVMTFSGFYDLFCVFIEKFQQKAWPRSLSLEFIVMSSRYLAFVVWNLLPLAAIENNVKFAGSSEQQI